MNRIYTLGYLLGGIFHYTLACELNHQVTAILSVAGAAFVGEFDNCNLTHPTVI